MPQSHSHLPLLTEAVRTVERLHRRAERVGSGSFSAEPGRSDPRPDGNGPDALRFDLDRCNPPPQRAAAYALGGPKEGWAVATSRPVADLMGWQAPPSCWAVVVVAPGRAIDLGRPSPPDTTGDLVVTVGVARSGEVAGRLSVGGAVNDDPPDGGRLLDTLKRNLDLPTPPPSEGTARFLTVLWLAALLDAAGGAPTRLGWRSVVRLHPAARLILDGGQRLNGAELEAIVAVAPTTLTWPILRAAEIRHASMTSLCSMTPLCPPHTAAWMDTGMYSRWVLADLPAPETLWHTVADCLLPAARRRLDAFLGAEDFVLDRQCRAPH